VPICLAQMTLELHIGHMPSSSGGAADMGSYSNGPMISNNPLSFPAIEHPDTDYLLSKNIFL
jgi:hypothetical protein